jgi:hypothetical protein
MFQHVHTACQPHASTHAHSKTHILLSDCSAAQECHAALVARRNWRSLALRLLSPCFFLLLALLLDAAVRADQNRTLNYEEVRDPERQEIKSIQSCSNDIFISQPCYDFVYSPDDNAAIQVLCWPMPACVWSVAHLRHMHRLCTWWQQKMQVCCAHPCSAYSTAWLW